MTKKNFKKYFIDHNSKTINAFKKINKMRGQSLVVVSNNKFLTKVKSLSKHFILGLNQLKKKYPKIIKDIRGRGLLVGIQLYKDQTNFIKRLTDKKLLTIRAAENVVRILPPLNVKKSELNQALKIINKVCEELS